MDGGITAERSPANGLARAERKARGLVVADGDRTRYQGGAYEVREASGRNAPTWVVPQDASLVPNGTGLYFFTRLPGNREQRGFKQDAFDKTMAGETMAAVRMRQSTNPQNNSTIIF